MAERGFRVTSCVVLCCVVLALGAYLGQGPRYLLFGFTVTHAGPSQPREDCDGTLLDSMGIHYEAWKHTAALFGITITAAAMVELAGKPVNELLDILASRSGVAVTPELRHEFFTTKSKYYLDHAQEVKVIGSVIDIVHAGAARGLPMAVASGGTRKHVMEGLTSTGLLPYFSAIVCGEDVPNGKPAPDAFLLAAEKLGVPPSGCVGYEDAALGMQAIRNAGYLAAVDVTQLPSYPHLTD